MLAKKFSRKINYAAIESVLSVDLTAEPKSKKKDKEKRVTQEQEDELPLSTRKVRFENDSEPAIRGQRINEVEDEAEEEEQEQEQDAPVVAMEEDWKKGLSLAAENEDDEPEGFEEV
jgi:hypothetical protein